jgi:hypothetical protein
MPGEPDSPGPWGEGPLVVDNSAWSRAHRPEVREDWNQALLADRFCISSIARLEILFSARDGEGFDELAERGCGATRGNWIRAGSSSRSTPLECTPGPRSSDHLSPASGVPS